MRTRIDIAVIGLTAILGSTTGVAQAAVGAQAEPTALTIKETSLSAPARLALGASSVSASRMVGVEAAQLRPNATYELISTTTRRNASSTPGSSSFVMVLARVKTDKVGKFSTRFVAPLGWIHDHLIEVQKAKGADLVEGANEWLTVTAPRPSLGLGADTVNAGSRAKVVVSGLRPHARYLLFSNISRRNAASVTAGSEDLGALRHVRTDTNGRAIAMIIVPDLWVHDHLIRIQKMKGQTTAPGADAWLTVLR